jgi:uncharacterized membrane protein
MGLAESAASGDRLAALRDLRDLLAAQIEACDSLRDLASLSGRLQSVLDEIDKLEGPKESGDAIDEIAQRRAARGASTGSGSVRASRSR